MFGKTNKAKGSTGTTRDKTPAGVPTIIGHDMTIDGNLKSEGDLHVAGKVQGDIRVKSLTVDKDAVIRGEVSAEQVRVCGQIIGCVRAREVILMATARVQGGIHPDVLSIEPGAILDARGQRL